MTRFSRKLSILMATTALVGCHGQGPVRNGNAGGPDGLSVSHVCEELPRPDGKNWKGSTVVTTRVQDNRRAAVWICTDTAVCSLLAYRTDRGGLDAEWMDATNLKLLVSTTEGLVVNRSGTSGRYDWPTIVIEEVDFPTFDATVCRPPWRFTGETPAPPATEAETRQAPKLSLEGLFKSREEPKS